MAEAEIYCRLLCCASLLSGVQPCNLKDGSPSGCSVHGGQAALVHSPGKNTGVDCHSLLQGIEYRLILIGF